MRNFLITTDNTTDFPKEYIDAHNLRVIDLTYSIDDIAYGESKGQTSHHFNNAVAYKFKDDTYETLTKDNLTKGVRYNYIVKKGR